MAVADMERVMAEAFKSLTGEDYHADITQIAFMPMGQGAEMTLKIHRRFKPSPGERS